MESSCKKLYHVDWMRLSPRVFETHAFKLKFLNHDFFEGDLE